VHSSPEERERGEDDAPAPQMPALMVTCVWGGQERAAEGAQGMALEVVRLEVQEPGAGAQVGLAYWCGGACRPCLGPAFAQEEGCTIE
jgi:hypothetical protein